MFEKAGLALRYKLLPSSFDWFLTGYFGIPKYISAEIRRVLAQIRIGLLLYEGAVTL